MITIRLPDRCVSAELNAESVRRALATLAEHGPDGVAAIIQGKLVAGIVAQPKVRPQAAAAEAA